MEGAPTREKDAIKDYVQVSLVTMLRTSATLRARMVNMGFQWFSVTLCYYGLSFASTKLSQNVFTDFMLRCCKKLKNIDKLWYISPASQLRCLATCSPC